MNLLKEYQECFGKFQARNEDTDTEFNIKVDSDKKEIYLRFEGSRSNQDWIQNFNFFAELNFHFFKGTFKKPFKTFFLVHRGIYEKYSSVEMHLHSIINPLLKEGYKLFIHGFSQGGGLTQIAHEDFWYFLDENKLNQEQLHSFAFASPMVFSWVSSKEFKKRFDNLIIIKNINDIVPKVPGFILGFRQYGKIIKIGKWKISFPWQWIKEHMKYETLLLKN